MVTLTKEEKVGRGGLYGRRGGTYRCRILSYITLEREEHSLVVVPETINNINC